MNLLINISLSAIITFASFFAIQNYVPLKYLETKQISKYGSAITTIQSTDTLKNSRTTINDNFTALNNGKIEISTTTLPLITTLSGLTSAASLATVGTITSGVWSGTEILTAKGGTGSTTLASNQVLLGNGTGNIGIVAGLGTTGQFLTSNGAGTAPTWQTSAVDTAINYNWTGNHTFSGNNLFTASTTHSATTTILANSATNNALVLNGVNYKFPSTQGASSTVLATDGSGSLTWNKVIPMRYSANGTFSLSGEGANNFATTTVFTLPAGTFSASSTIHIYGYDECQETSSNGGSCTLSLRDANGNTFSSFSASVVNGNSTYGNFNMHTANFSSLSSQKSSTFFVNALSTGASFATAGSNTTSSIDTSGDITLNLVANANSANLNFTYFITFEQ